MTWAFVNPASGYSTLSRLVRLSLRPAISTSGTGRPPVFGADLADACAHPSHRRTLPLQFHLTVCSCRTRLPFTMPPPHACVADEHHMPDDQPVEKGTLDSVLDQLLADHPDAPVAAIGADGLLASMPAAVPVGEHPVLDARSALDLVVPADRVVIITSWEQTRRAGLARAGVRLAAESGFATVFFVDARHAHGVYVAVVLLEAGGDGTSSLWEAARIPPRVCRVRKNELAVILDIDDATTKILGWTDPEMVDRCSLEFIHPDDRDRAIENWMEMLATPGGEHRWRGRHQHRDGSWVWMEITNRNMLDDGRDGYVLAEMVDISDEMAAQEALRAREQLLHRMSEALPIGLFQVDRDRSIVY